MPTTMPPGALQGLNVSPTATVLAVHLHHLTLAAGGSTVPLQDTEAATTLGMAPFTLWEALRDLATLGAITYTRRTKGGTRTVTVRDSSWVWAAVRELLAEDGAL